ncbi:hypothetical protein C8F04DRAFT_228878 [Mycena alexandri]|uniref:Uncharacterized protein n=1 Tax=Mycena alexandri TaxID=1745969 RepID=A0AAD6T7Y3_9AGAR|nr:hypothetical protein C8F04DRAFT_228878 [Mycena alexandri]
MAKKLLALASRRLRDRTSPFCVESADRGSNGPWRNYVFSRAHLSISRIAVPPSPFPLKTNPPNKSGFRLAGPAYKIQLHYPTALQPAHIQCPPAPPTTPTTQHALRPPPRTPRTPRSGHLYARAPDHPRPEPRRHRFLPPPSTTAARRERSSVASSSAMSSVADGTGTATTGPAATADDVVSFVCVVERIVHSSASSVRPFSSSVAHSSSSSAHSSSLSAHSSSAAHSSSSSSAHASSSSLHSASSSTHPLELGLAHS